MRLVVTGGAGYIGSHTAALLLQAGHSVAILDNFANAERTVPDRIGSIAGRSADVFDADITDAAAVRDSLRRAAPDAVIHFAGLKSVARSVADPLEYYRVNVGGSVNLFEAMQGSGCKRLIFSSSATVYGAPLRTPISEDHPISPTTPYGASKHMVERIIEDWALSDPDLAAINLRYFNPVGAHPSARIGELPQGRPDNLMPFIAQVATGQRDELSVFGDDWPTPDGTGVRDYIHVMDVAEAHLAALELSGRETGSETLNIGTGRGYSVFELIAAFEAASGRTVSYRVESRRSGDIATSLADPSRAQERLGWRATRTLEQMCADAWAWQRSVNQ